MKFDPEVEAALHQAKERLWAGHRDDPNVHGVGIGFRNRGGQWTDEPVVVAIVGKKRPAGYVSRRRLLPTSVDVEGKPWGVDVIQAGPFSWPLASDSPATGASTAVQTRPAAAGSGKKLTDPWRPPQQGVSISNYNDTENNGNVAGSLGCFVVDNTDGSICMLSANHVIARENLGELSVDPIVQPGRLDGGLINGTTNDTVATLKRFVSLADGTTVDAAIAQLTDQTYGGGYTDAIPDDVMPPISRTHPAVGMVVAGDQFGTSLLTRMDATVAATNVTLLGSDPVSGGVGAVQAVKAPEPFMNIEKVGRTTGYTTATIIVVGTHVEVDTRSSLGTLTYTDLILALFFIDAGDSGSIACEGGVGNPEAVSEFLALPCELLAAAANYYDIPQLTSDEALSDTLRDDFLSQSLIGRLMITTTYVNTQTVKDRWDSRVGSDEQQTEQSYAQYYYAKYHDFVATVLEDPTSKAVVTEENLDDLAIMIAGSSAPDGIMTQAETDAANAIYTDVFVNTLGMNRQQVIDYFNDHDAYQTVYNHLAAVPTIELTGPISTTGH